MMFESLSWRTTLTSGSFTHDARELCRCDNLNPALIYYSLLLTSIATTYFARLLVRNKNVQDNNPETDKVGWGVDERNLQHLSNMKPFSSLWARLHSLIVVPLIRWFLWDKNCLECVLPRVYLLVDRPNASYSYGVELQTCNDNHHHHNNNINNNNHQKK